MIEIPEFLIRFPEGSVLNDGVDFYCETSPVTPQPQAGVIAMIVLGATVMGRRFVTKPGGNYPSLYAVYVALTSTGKQHFGTVLRHLLRIATIENKPMFERLMGGDGYTSDGGIITTLRKKPCHLTILDELGIYLQSVKNNQNHLQTDVRRTLMALWSSLHDIWTPKSYSEETKREPKAEWYCRHPAISIMAMTTPSTLYKNLNKRDVTDGFLPRFLIAESLIRADDIEYRPVDPIEDVKRPNRLIKWMEKCATAYDANGDQASSNTAMGPPNPVRIALDESCLPILKEYEKRIKSYRQDYEEDIYSIFGKSYEMAMRVSLIVAVSCGSDRILPVHLKWSIKLVDYYSRQTANRLFTSMDITTFQRHCQEIFKIIDDGGSNGATMAEIRRKYKDAGSWAAESKYEQALMTTIKADFHVVLEPRKHQTAGRPTDAYVAESRLEQS